MVFKLLQYEGNLLQAPGGGYLGTSTTEIQFVPFITLTLTDEGNDVRATMGVPPESCVAYRLQFNGTVNGLPHDPHVFQINDVTQGSRIIGTKDEVYGPFIGNNRPYETNAAMVDDAGEVNPIGQIVSQPRGPTAPVYSARTGDADGQIVVRLLTAPTSSGDGPAVGDGLGGAMSFQISIDGALPPTDYGTLGAIPAEYIISDLEPGTQVVVMARCMAYRSGDFGPPVTVTVKETVVVGDPPVDLGLMTPQTLTTGDSWTIDWDSYFSGADLYTVQAGITGGVSGGGLRNDTYTVASLPTGNFTVQIKAQNLYGSVISSWDIEVEVAVVMPSVKTEPDDIIVTVGESVNLSLPELFNGTTPLTFSCAQADANFGIVSGVFKNLVALASPLVSKNYTIRATNAAGFAEFTIAVEVTVIRPDKLTTTGASPDVEIIESLNRYTSPDYRYPVTVLNVFQRAVYWSTTTPDANDVIPATNYEPLALSAPTGPANGPWAYISNYVAATRTVTIAWFSGVGAITIDWGDSSSTANAPMPSSHLYSSAGTKTITVTDSATPTPQVATIVLITSSQEDTEYQPYMKDPGKAGVFSPTRRDFSVYGVSEATRATNYRVAFLDTVQGVLSHWSDPITVPAVVVPPPPTTVKVYQSVMSTKATKAAGLVGNPGMQFQRCIFRNRGVNDASKRTHVFTMQDENRVWFSADDGRTWGPLPMVGMWGSKAVGGYANSDENLLICVVHGWSALDGGIHVSRDWGKTCKRLSTARGGSQKFQAVTNGQRGHRVPINGCDRRKQKAAAPFLTDAERPIWFVENAHATPNSNLSDIENVYLWKSDDGGDSVSLVTTLPKAKYVSGGAGIYRVTACPNGDVIFSGKKGAFLNKISGTGTYDWANPDTLSSLEIIHVHLFGGDHDSPCGAYMAATSGVGGIWISSNVRTDAFTKPNGNAGLGTSPQMTAFEIWPGSTGGNSDRMLAARVDGANPFLSTDGGRNWNTCNNTPLDGEDSSLAWRYQYKADNTGCHNNFSVSLVDTTKVLAHNKQTIAYSINSGNAFVGNYPRFFDGSHTHGRGESRTNWLEQAVIQQDRCFQPSDDGLVSIINQFELTSDYVIPNPDGAGNTTLGAKITQYGGGSAGNTSGNGVVVCPGGRYIAFYRKGDVGGVPVLISGLNGSNGTASSVVPKNYGITEARIQFWHPTVADQVYVGRFSITGLNTNNPTFTDHKVNTAVKETIGYSYTGTPKEWRTYWTGKSKTENQIFVSTNQAGTGLTTLFSALPDFNHFAIIADPFTKNQLLYVRRNDPLKIRLLKPNVGGTDWSDTVACDMEVQIKAECVKRGVPSGQVQLSTNQSVSMIIADHNMPGLFYCANGGFDDQDTCAGFLWRSFDYGSSWECITAHAPVTAWDIDVSQLTGNFIGFSSMGTWVWAVPDSYPAMPDRNKMFTALETFYDTVNVYPPVFG